MGSDTLDCELGVHQFGNFRTMLQEHDQKYIEMNRARLENGRGTIPNTLGRPELHGNLNLGQCWTALLVFRKNESEKMFFVEIDSSFFIRT